MLFTWWQQAGKLSTRKSHPVCKTRRNHARLRVESLEERVVPAGSPLDPTFGNQGLVRGTFQGYSNTTGTSEVILGNGQILVAGSAGGNEAVSRFNPDGSQDYSFGQAGIAAYHPGAFDSVANAIAVQADGKILLEGNSSFATFIIRLNADGSLDRSFGTSSTTGYVSLSFGDIGDSGTGILAEPDGTIEIAGSRQLFGSKEGFLARFNADGSPDTTFGTNGVVQQQLSNNSGWSSLIDDGSGGVYTAGFAGNDFAVAEFDHSGQLVRGFGINGVLTVNMGTGSSNSHANKLTLDGAGNLVLVGGTTRPGTGSDFAITRVTATGQLDTSFGTNGIVVLDFSGANDEAKDVGIAADGSIVIAGQANDEFGLVKLDGSGNLLAQYATDFLASNDRVGAGAFDANGRFIIAGTSHATDTYDHMALAAYYV
jgi:uncharacterized delta-60 repeat protein